MIYCSRRDVTSLYINESVFQMDQVVRNVITALSETIRNRLSGQSARSGYSSMSRRPISTRPVLYPLVLAAIVIVANYTLRIVFFDINYLRQNIITETIVPILLAVPIGINAARKRRDIYKLNLKLQEMVDHDALTRLKSRQFLLSNFKANTEDNCVVMMIDVDHFKALNDAHGHQVGDRALQHMAGIFVDCCRSSDVISRYGGEEFVIILKDSDLHAAAMVAKRIRKTLAQSPLDTGNGEVTLTVSIGISLLREEDDIEDALVRADTAMYLAKEKGRDRIELEVVA